MHGVRHSDLEPCLASSVRNTHCRAPSASHRSLIRRTYTSLTDGSYVFLVQSVTLTAVLGPATETDFAVDTTGPVLTNVQVAVGCAGHQLWPASMSPPAPLPSAASLLGKTHPGCPAVLVILATAERGWHRYVVCHATRYNCCNLPQRPRALSGGCSTCKVRILQCRRSVTMDLTNAALGTSIVVHTGQSLQLAFATNDTLDGPNADPCADPASIPYPTMRPAHEAVAPTRPWR